MKRTAIYMLAVAIGLGVWIIISGCASPRIKRLSSSRFLERAAQIEQLHSAHWTTYVGVSGQRAYLEFGHPAIAGSGTRTSVFWTPLSELPEDLVEKLQAGDPPWTPRSPGTNMTGKAGN